MYIHRLVIAISVVLLLAAVSFFVAALFEIFRPLIGV